MKVLIVINQLGLGGTEKHILKIMPRVNSSEIQLTVFSFRAGGLIIPNLIDEGVNVIAPKVFNRGVFGTFISLYYLLKAYLNERPDIVHYYLPESYILGGLCLLPVSCRKIMSRRSLGNYQKGRLLISRIEKFLHKRMDRIVGNSKAVINDLVEEGVPPDKTTLIYNGVEIIERLDLRECKHKRQQEKIKKDALIFLVIANLIPYKGHRDLFIALGRIKDKLPTSWLLLCVGRDHGIKSELVDLACEFGIQENIKFPGGREDITDLINISDIAISSAHEEGFSNSILEYMSGGLPVIAYDVGGNSEAIINDVTGIIVPARDTSKLGEAILNLIHDNTRRVHFSRTSKKRILERFSIESCVEKYTSLYKMAMNEIESGLG